MTFAEQDYHEDYHEDFPTDLGYHGADEVPPGHPDELTYRGWDPEGGQPCPHSPHWRHCATCNPS
jgi:hypothetical protein